MKPDISSRQDIKFIITKFYDRLLSDKAMIPFFEDIIQKKDLEHHLEVITDFWSDILLDTNVYTQNVMKKHLDKNTLIKFKKQHFIIWVSYLITTINANFNGEKASLMTNRARSIATIMQLKMNLYE